MDLVWALSNLTPSAIIDILLVAVVFFGLSFLIRATQSAALLRGLLLAIILAVAAANLLGLPALRWLVQNGLGALLVAIPVIFQPELRRTFERLGRADSFLRDRQQYDTIWTRVIDDVCQAAERLSERRHGALIVLARSVSLEEYVRTGVPLDAEVSPQLLLTVFWPKTELHDGAAIIGEDGRLAAAAAVLPLSSARQLGTPKLGTRHRAAIGISEVSDAVVVIVSEETGRIAIANAGRLIPKLDSKRLRTILLSFYGREHERRESVFQRLWHGLRQRRAFAPVRPPTPPPPAEGMELH
ncbi:MAG: diadenylate cyclase CdaA [Anaerolineae bacterium]|nr:diadenylate cyclase CdaA [Anaerolineae bacterium]NUQ04386.1 TIGR00159 family protein [Anaerolineae bacterium]